MTELTYKQAQCAQCRRVFSTVANFDRHLGKPHDPRCSDPGEAGLVQNERGVWHSPGPDRAEWRARA